MTSQALYPCSQPALYQTERAIIFRLRENLTAFAYFRAVYTDEYCEVLLANIATAEAMPNEQARMLTHETIRAELIELDKQCRNKWQAGKRYIAYCYPDTQEDNWDAFGWSSYEAASNESWTAVNALMTAATTYLVLHTDALAANNNMPLSFPAALNNLANAFKEKYNEFTLAQQDAVTGTVAKINANNATYTSIINISMDSAVIYSDNSTMRDLFSFSTVCGLVVPSGASSANITVINDETKTPIIAQVQIQGSDKMATTNAATGKCEITQLASGSTVFNITADGFVKQTITKVLNIGAASRIEVSMVKQFTVQDTPQPVVETAAPIAVTAAGG